MKKCIEAYASRELVKEEDLVVIRWYFFLFLHKKTYAMGTH